MKLMMKPLVVLAVAIGAIYLGEFSNVDAQAQSLTNNMTCDQAKREFERRGRVNTRSRLGNVLPIFGGVPISKKHRLRCGPFKTPSVTTVITRDRRSCPISARCG